MLRKRLHQFTATLLAAVWLYGAGLQLVEIDHPFGDDVACGEIGLASARDTGTKVGVAAKADADGHCAVCHLQRTLSHALLLAPSAIRDLGPTSAESSAQQLVPLAQHAELSSSRAPPTV